jgi:serine/threonine protein kinase
MKDIRNICTFDIVRKIADGGMGSVYEAMQTGANGFQKRVALKTLLPDMSRNLRFVEMFIGEAKLVADLVHENIVQIYQLGRSQDGYYIVMEYVSGLTLHDFIRLHVVTKEPVPPVLAVFIASRITRGVAFAHQRRDHEGNPLNIVHRDICPNNIMITTEGLPKLADFGIASARTLSSGADGTLVGKVCYMSPEQAAPEKAVDHRADIFCLGAVLFELLCGERIRGGTDHEEVLERALRGEVAWEALSNFAVDAELDRILRKCMAPNPDDRYDTASELAHDLEYYIYKDGYGPTIQTLEEYLMKQFPYLYISRQKQDEINLAETAAISGAAAEGTTILGAMGPAASGDVTIVIDE